MSDRDIAWLKKRRAQPRAAQESLVWETVDAIADHIEETGYPPSIRELGKRLGLTSPDSVRERLLAAVDAGLIERGPGARQIRIVEPSGVPVRDAYGEVGAGAGTPEEKGRK